MATLNLVDIGTWLYKHGCQLPLTHISKMLHHNMRLRCSDWTCKTGGW